MKTMNTMNTMNRLNIYNTPTFRRAATFLSNLGSGTLPLNTRSFSLSPTAKLAESKRLASSLTNLGQSPKVLRAKFLQSHPGRIILNNYNKRLFSQENNNIMSAQENNNIMSAPTSGGYFNNIIPSTYILNKNKAIILTLSLSNLYDENYFTNMINQNVVIGNNYIVYVKVRYNYDKFIMVGNPFGFHFESEHLIQDIQSIVEAKLKESLEYYNLTDDDIEYIQLTIRKVDSKLLSEFKLDKVETNFEKIDTKTRNKLLSIPVSVNLDNLGKSLPIIMSEFNKDQISNISVNIKGINVNFLDIILSKTKFIRPSHKDHITSFDSSWKFYLLNDGIDFVLAINKIDKNRVEKIKYSLSGVVLNHIVDIIDNNLLIRHWNQKEFIFKDYKLIQTKSNIKFTAIPKPVTKPLFIENSNIGAIDSETYKDNQGIHKIYSIGFKTNLQNEPLIYYIGQDLNYSKVVLDMINELLRPKYNNITFYCHNLGGYDIVFILKILFDYNEKQESLKGVEPNKYDISCIMRDSNVIKVTIKKDSHVVKILDSYAMLNNSLKDLCKSFEVSEMKTTFPYNFSTESNLFYKGQMPEFKYYVDITKKQYKELARNAPDVNNWSFYDETIKYLKIDINSLYEVLIKANKRFFLDYNVDMQDSITISSLAVRIFLKNYYENNIPDINKSSVYRDIKEAYYGGITEVYKPLGYNLYYYDVNSLYPYVALNDMAGLEVTKIEFYNDADDIKDLFGFFYCEVESPLDSYLGILPVRTKSGLTFPLGSWKGWYFSEELKFAQDNGYKITVVKGYTFNREKDVFKNYINKVYQIKCTTDNKVQKSVAKSLLNNLLGRFGINIEKPITELVDKNKFIEISLLYKVKDYKKISNNSYLVNYIPRIDPDVVNSHKMDFIKLVNKFKDNESTNLDVTSIVISAAVTAYARIHITKLKLSILNKGGQLYYSDTDSIVTDIELDKNLVSTKELGKLKLEHKVDKGIFISGKLYWMSTDQGKVVVKAKGIKGSSITYFDYVKLLNKESITTAVKRQSKTDWSEGQVVIYDQENIKINHDSYTKRTKIFNEQNIWIDTKPYIIGQPLEAKNTEYNSKFVDNSARKISLFKKLRITLYYYSIVLFNKRKWIYIYLYLFILFTSNLTLFMYNLSYMDIWLSDISPSTDVIAGNQDNIRDYLVEYDETEIDDFESEQTYIPELLANIEPIIRSESQQNFIDFLNKYLGMLNFNKYTYYPSCFQDSNLPKIIENGFRDNVNHYLDDNPSNNLVIYNTTTNSPSSTIISSPRFLASRDDLLRQSMNEPLETSIRIALLELEINNLKENVDLLSLELDQTKEILNNLLNSYNGAVDLSRTILNLLEHVLSRRTHR